MALAYRPPGVYVSEEVSPQISPILAAPALVCLVGLTQGFITRTDQFVISGVSATPLPGLPEGAALSSVVSVKNALDPSQGAADGSGYTLTTDYTVSVGAGTVTRVGAGSIPDNTLLNITYRYVPENYFAATRLYDLGSIESRYGAAYTTDGNAINSPVSYAASIAFENGADSVVVQPLLKRATPGDHSTEASQPTTVQAGDPTQWGDSLHVLRDIEDINVVVPIVGQDAEVSDADQLSIFQKVQDHMHFMSQSDQWLVSIFGEDSTTGAVATEATLRTHASTLRGRYGGATAQQSVLHNVTSATRARPGSSRPLSVGGQYFSAAIAGMLASRPVSSSLTRKVVAGFGQVENKRDPQAKNADAAAGITVVENRSGNIIIRHALTLDQTSVARSELAVVRAKHRLIESIRDTIDRYVIGNVIADNNAPSVVRQTVIGVLELLAQAKDIVSYGGVQARYVSFDPTTIQVRFSYRPSYTLNYVEIVFDANLSNGTITTDNVLTTA